MVKKEQEKQKANKTKLPAKQKKTNKTPSFPPSKHNDLQFAVYTEHWHSNVLNI